jgi:hypothetical protein
MALAAADLERTLTSAKTQMRVLRGESSGPSVIALIIAGVLVGAAILIASRLSKRHVAEDADPSYEALMALPEDDEPTTTEEEAEVAEARAQLLRGEGVSWEQLRDELKTG